LRDRQAEQIQLLKFQQKEIMDASIVPGEDAKLEQERLRLKNKEVLFQTVNGIIDALYNEHGSVIERLVTAKKDLEKASRIDQELSPKAESMTEATFHLEDIAVDLRILNTSKRSFRKLKMYPTISQRLKKGFLTLTKN
jgi:DNA repair protein RecN (Recombination protein N)